MIKQVDITVFPNVHSLPEGTVNVNKLDKVLVPVEELNPVTEVLREHKEWETRAYSMCSFQDLSSATQENIDKIYGVVLDFDDGHTSFDLVRDVLSGIGCEVLIHTTASHTQDNFRLRAIIPYDEPLMGQEGIAQHKVVWAYFNELVGPLDPAGKNPVQKWLFPKYIQEGEAFQHEYIEGSDRFSAKEVKAPAVKKLEPQTDFHLLVQSTDNEELTGFLEVISPVCSRLEWFETIAAVINVFGRSEEVISALDKWSQGSPDQYDREDFYKAVESIRDDHQNKAGLGKLRYLAGFSPNAEIQDERIRTDDLEAIVKPEQQARAVELAARTHSHTIDLLNKFDNDPNELHEKAIWSICEGLSYSALASKPIRVAYPLPTGMGKTSAFRCFVKSIQECGLDISLAYCAERIEDLADLKLNLIKDGICEDKIGLLHSSSYTHKDISSIDRSEAENYQFLLLAHGRVQHQYSNPSTYLYYEGRKRDLVVWDEALLTTNGIALNVDMLRGDIANWRKVYESKRSEGRTPLGSEVDFVYMDKFLTEVEALLAQGQWDAELSLPEFDVIRFNYRRSLYAILGRSRTSELEKLIEYSGINGKLIRAGSNKAFVRYEVVVPDGVDKIVVLDAGAEINQLIQYDQTVKLGDIGDVHKDYQSVTIYYTPVKSSRDYLGQEFRQSPESNHYLKELGHIVQDKIPENEEFLLFTYKDRNNIQYKTQILDYLDTLGLGCRERCNVITWGNERGTNRFSHIKYAITVGVVYRDPSEIAASIIGQKRDMGYSVSNEEIKEVSNSLQADILYQGLSRGYMRCVRNGVAGEMTCWVLHKEQRAIDMLVKALPNVSIEHYFPRYLSEHGVSDAVANWAEQIVCYLNALPEDVEQISIRRIVQDLRIENTNTRKWRDAVKRVEELQFEWIRPDRAQSFYRRETRTNLTHEIDKTILLR